MIGGVSGEIWEDLGRYWRDLGKCGEIWRDLARCSEMWRDVGCRARMASAAPSIGLRRGHIGFRLFFRNVGQKRKKIVFFYFRQMFDRCSIDFP